MDSVLFLDTFGEVLYLVTTALILAASMAVLHVDDPVGRVERDLDDSEAWQTVGGESP